ncbi:unnamed protein product [Macrosiphum euphorbiae]|uniref:Uncharacterized protein n=1 Tax=Macrosiphum euphorbiae TaxID=13131 RepID=A0AAV0XBG1_9HEMI|nr:unnamed protein product [Macrosiphum euphorbiae]
MYYFRVSGQSAECSSGVHSSTATTDNNCVTPSTPPTRPQRHRVGREDKSAWTRTGCRRTLSRSPTAGQLIQSTVSYHTTSNTPTLVRTLKLSSRPPRYERFNKKTRVIQYYRDTRVSYYHRR